MSTILVAVKFKKNYVFVGPEYYYRADDTVSVGDVVVVNKSRQYVDLDVALVTRVGIQTLRDASCYDHIVQVVDVSDYKNRQMNQNKIVELKSRLDKLAKSMSETALYESLAKIDDEFREIYLEYKQALERK